LKAWEDKGIAIAQNLVKAGVQTSAQTGMFMTF